MIGMRLVGVGLLVVALGGVALCGAAAAQGDDKFEKQKKDLQRVEEMMNKYPFKQYPGTAAGLKEFFEDCIKYAKNGKNIDVIGMARDNLLLPKHEEWFKGQFGEVDGRIVAKEYDVYLKQFEIDFMGIINKMIKDGWTDVVVPEKQSEYQEKIEKRMQKKVRLYAVRLVPPVKAGENPEDRKGFHMYSFAYVDGRWRFLGKLKSLGE